MHEAIYEPFKQAFVKATAALKKGDPRHEVRALAARTVVLRRCATHASDPSRRRDAPSPRARGALVQDTFIGPIISEGDAKRIESWVDRAVQAGARLLVGGKRQGVLYGGQRRCSKRQVACTACD